MLERLMMVSCMVRERKRRSMHEVSLKELQHEVWDARLLVPERDDDAIDDDWDVCFCV